MRQASLRQFTLLSYLVLLVNVLAKTRNLTRRQYQDMKLVLGEPRSGGCSKRMLWKDPSSTFDKDILSTNLVLYNNAWAASSTTTGSSQSVECKSFANGAVAWYTAFDITALPGQENQVKSYPNVVWSGTPILVSALKNFAITWNWSLRVTKQPAVMDVSLDIFLANTPACRSQNCASREVMVWMAAVGGAKPAGQKTSKTPIKIGNCHFDVWQGTVNVPVVSLIPTDETQRFTGFKGDLKKTMADLAPYGVLPSEYIFSVGSGLETFRGKGTLTTSRYSIYIN